MLVKNAQLRNSMQRWAEWAAIRHAAMIQDFFNGGVPGWRMQRKQAIRTANGHKASRQQSMLATAAIKLYSPRSPECPNAAGVHAQQGQHPSQLGLLQQHHCLLRSQQQRYSTQQKGWLWWHPEHPQPGVQGMSWLLPPPGVTSPELPYMMAACSLQSLCNPAIQLQNISLECKM